MSTEIENRIQALQAEIDQLKVQKEHAKKERAALDEAYKRLKAQLKEAGLGFDALVRFALKDVRRVLEQVDKEAASEEVPRTRKTAKKKAAPKSRGPRQARAAGPAIKIPAGRYGNVPANPDAVYQVKEKGPRPKPLKAYAEEIGIDAFLERCRLGD